VVVVRPHFLAIRLLTLTNLDVVREQSVEEVDVGVTQHGEVLVLLNGRLLHLEQTETFTQLSAQLQLFFCSLPISLLTSLHLVLVAVNTGRGETVGPEVPPGLVLVGSAVVGTVLKVSIALELL
jgi:hypothetical protein